MWWELMHRETVRETAPFLKAVTLQYLTSPGERRHVTSLYARSVSLLSLNSVCAADSPTLLIEREEGVKKRKRGSDKTSQWGRRGRRVLGWGIQPTETLEAENQLKGWSENAVVTRDGVMLPGKLKQEANLQEGVIERWVDGGMTEPRKSWHQERSQEDCCTQRSHEKESV